MAITPKWKIRQDAYRAENNEFFEGARARREGRQARAVATPEEVLARGGYFDETDESPTRSGRRKIRGVNLAQSYASRRAARGENPEKPYERASAKMENEQIAKDEKAEDDYEDRYRARLERRAKKRGLTLSEMWSGTSRKRALNPRGKVIGGVADSTPEPVRKDPVSGTSSLANRRSYDIDKFFKNREKNKNIA